MQHANFDEFICLLYYSCDLTTEKCLECACIWVTKIMTGCKTSARTFIELHILLHLEINGCQVSVEIAETAITQFLEFLELVDIEIYWRGLYNS